MIGPRSRRESPNDFTINLAVIRRVDYVALLPIKGEKVKRVIFALRARLEGDEERYNTTTSLGRNHPVTRFRLPREIDEYSEKRFAGGEKHDHVAIIIVSFPIGGRAAVNATLRPVLKTRTGPWF